MKNMTTQTEDKTMKFKTTQKAIDAINEAIMTELKPCPFCGSKPFVWRTNHRTYIECPNLTAESHRVMMSGESDKEAIEAWNRRCGR